MQDCDTALPTSSSIRQGSHSLGPLCLLSWLILNLAGGGYADQSVELPEIARQAIEADWAQQDATRVAQLVEPGTIRLPGKVIEWPGLPRGSVPTIPETPSPTLDGRLDDPCWEHALKLEPPQNGDPSYLLCHDGEMLYVGVTIPAASEARFRGPLTSVDAAGAVDGVKDGRYAFHTGGDVKPWWQVDLGRSERIGRIVVYNRLDYQPGLHNADHLLILASNDGETWRLIHENLQHFGGITGAPPLQVQFDNLEARFIRLQIAEDRPILFHLDEVEIYSAEEPDRNLALHKLATQSTLSIWSRGGPLGSAYFMIGGARMGLTLADPPRVTLNDRVVGYSAATRTEGGIVVKFALALRTLGETFPSEVYLAGQIKQPVRLGGRWQVTWPPRLALSYGWNRLVLNIEAAAPFDPPLRATIETVGLTPFALHRRQVGQAVVNGPGPLVLEFPVEVEGAAAVIVTMDQGLTSLTEARPFFVPPVRETVRRGQALLRDFGRPAPIEFRKLRARLRELECRETT
ncbi:MAG: discoidin domain-containing protein, partial [Candidatus Zipacnadales bacterium]